MYDDDDDDDDVTNWRLRFLDSRAFGASFLAPSALETPGAFGASLPAPSAYLIPPGPWGAEIVTARIRFTRDVG